MKQTSAFITIIGRPNVGKSSLMNRILGQKVAIVSDKPQTTRTKIMGIKTENENQLVFIDTPGFHKARNELDKSMNKAVSDGMSDVDVAVLVVEANPKFKFDSDNLPPAEVELINQLKKRKLKALLVINKIDLLEKKEELLKLIDYIYNEYIILWDRENYPEGKDHFLAQLRDRKEELIEFNEVKNHKGDIL